MLSIQPKMNQTAFGHVRHNVFAEQDDYQQQRAEFIRQKREFDELANDEQTPNAMKKLFGAGSLLLGGVAVGLTAGCGTKILIEKAQAFKSSNFMKKAGEYGAAFKDFVNKSFETIKAQFKKSDLYKKPKNYLEPKYNKFAESNFGKPIVKFVKTVKNMIKAGYAEIKKGFDFIKNKIKGVKSETYEKAAVGTVGTASGACSILNGIKARSEAGEE